MCDHGTWFDAKITGELNNVIPLQLMIAAAVTPVDTRIRQITNGWFGLAPISDCVLVRMESLKQLSP